MQLGDEVGAADERLGPQPPGGDDGERRRGDDDGGADEVDGLLAHAPQGEAADGVARPGPPPGGGAGLGGEHERGHARRRPAGEPADVGEDGDGDEGGAGGGPGGGTAGCPRRAGTRQPPGGQLAGDGPDDRPGERHGAQPLGDGPGEHRSPGDRSEQQVADVGGLDRDRSAVAAAAQTEGDGDGDAEAEDGRATVEHVGDLRRRRRLVADEPAQPEHDATADEGGEVHAVGDLEPLQVAEPAHPPCPPQLLRRRSTCGARRAILLAVDVEAAQLFFSLLALVAGAGALTLVVLRLVAPRSELVAAVDDAALWIAFLVAATCRPAACTSPRSPTSCRAGCAGSSASPCTRWP